MPPQRAAAAPEKNPDTSTELAPRIDASLASEGDRTVPLSRIGSTPPRPQEAPPRSAPRWMFLAVPLAAALLAGFFVLLIGFRQPRIRITSDPEGAVVLVDGRPAPEVTPLEIRGLEPGEPHRIELRAAGMRAWQRDITPEPGETVAIHARLEQAAPSPPAPQPSPATNPP